MRQKRASARAGRGGLDLEKITLGSGRGLVGGEEKNARAHAHAHSITHALKGDLHYFGFFSREAFDTLCTFRFSVVKVLFRPFFLDVTL